jgi:flavin reductase (DIM6/NTAB) family NADH-FMN oxidoreductase RutF
VGGDFVVNLVTENLLDAMTLSAADFPPDKSEIEAAGLNASPSVHVKAPRLAEAEVSLECRLFRAERLGAGSLYIGEVVLFHVADRLMGPRLHVNGFAPLGRLGSPATYCRTTDRFEAPRIRYTDWAKK